MSESIQTQGKTVNEAVSEALLQLGLRRDEVVIEVIEEPKSGLLGFIGSRPAKVLVSKKPERRRGRGRGQNGRQDDDQAHTLGTGTGTGRGRRGRSRKSDNQDGDRQQSRGRGGSKADNGRDEDSDDNRRGRRGRRGGRGRGRGRAGGDQGEERRAGAQVEAGGNSRTPAAEGEGEARKSGRSRRGGRGRGRGRGRSENQEPSSPRQAEASAAAVDDVAGTPEAATRNESGGGRSRRNDRDDGGSGKRSRSRRERPAPEAEAATDSGNIESTGNTENAVSEAGKGGNGSDTKINNTTTNTNPQPEGTQDMAEDHPAADATPTPASATPADATPPPAADTPAEDETPKAAKPSRTGWGGSLGARLPRKDNPAVKNRKPVEVLADAPAPSGSSVTRRDGGGRDRYGSSGGGPASRGPGPSDDGEVIVADVPATRYAEALEGVTEANLDSALSDLASGMLVRAGFPCEVGVTPGEYRQVNISAEDEDDAGMLIGRHGQTIEAVEHLVERMASNAIDDRVRMNLDINSYRERREEALVERIAEVIGEVRETGRPYHAEPMNARERRLVHLQVADVEGLTTYTVVGSGGKHVVIALEDEGGDDGGDQD